MCKNSLFKAVLVEDSTNMMDMYLELSVEMNADE